MSRIKVALTIGGVTVAAGLMGWAVGMLYAPASGKELRRRLAWKTEEQCHSIARASERLLARASGRVAAQIEEARKRFTQPTSPV